MDTQAFNSHVCMRCYDALCRAWHELDFQLSCMHEMLPSNRICKMKSLLSTLMYAWDVTLVTASVPAVELLSTLMYAWDVTVYFRSQTWKPTFNSHVCMRCYLWPCWYGKMDHFQLSCMHEMLPFLRDGLHQSDFQLSCMHEMLHAPHTYFQIRSSFNSHVCMRCYSIAWQWNQQPNFQLSCMHEMLRLNWYNPQLLWLSTLMYAWDVTRIRHTTKGITSFNSHVCMRCYKS